ncbi:MAG: diguanylate cyclase, partial [Acidobacteriota bacterium]
MRKKKNPKANRSTPPVSSGKPGDPDGGGRTRRNFRGAPRRKTYLYGGLGFFLGLVLTVCGYLVDYFSLYMALPDKISFPLIRGLHEVTPVHYFTDGFAILLGGVGALAGWFQDKVLYYSNHLEELVTERTVALRRSEERYALAAQGANDGLWDLNVATGEMFYSHRWKQNLGYGKNGIAGTLEAWLKLIHPQDLRRFKARLDNHLSGASPNLQAEYRIRHRDGSYRWMLARGMAVRDQETGKPYRMAGSQTDIDIRKKMEQQLMFMALHDSLTELPNRTLFLDRLGHAFDRSKKQRRKNSLAILFLDLDRFKFINDRLGHMEGDRVLVKVTKRIQSCLEGVAGSQPKVSQGKDGSRGSEMSWTFARLGGDEFTILLEDIRSIREATNLIRKIEEEFRQPFLADGRKLFLTLSTGIVMGPSNYERPEDLLRDADTAMYRAKANGRARFEVFDQEMLKMAKAQLRLEHDLHLALEQNQIGVVYHPIVDFQTGHLAGLEVLGRWKHPKRGVLLPIDFIPMAEETGLILELGRWVFSEACRELGGLFKEWPEIADLTIGINLSPKQLFDPKLLPEFQAICERTGLDPKGLHLEITESSLIK